jgi:hypothetical protein
MLSKTGGTAAKIVANALIADVVPCKERPQGARSLEHGTKSTYVQCQALRVDRLYHCHVPAAGRCHLLMPNGIPCRLGELRCHYHRLARQNLRQNQSTDPIIRRPQREALSHFSIQSNSPLCVHGSPAATPKVALDVFQASAP